MKHHFQIEKKFNGEKRAGKTDKIISSIISIIFFFLIVFVFQLNLSAQNKNTTPTNFPEPVFEHLTVADGLPENSIVCILQDHLGYLWLGTQNGLVRYDGYNMKVYQPDADDSLSISSRRIVSIYEDKSGNLWVGTLKGLNCFNRSTETFTSYMHNPDDSTSINSNWIWNINGDKEGRLFIGTENGLNLFDQQTNSFRRIYTQKSIRVKAFMEDTITGYFYVAVNNKVMIYDPENEVLEMSDITVSNIILGLINSFYQAKDGTIWIGHSKGLARFNSLNNTIKYYQPALAQNGSKNIVDNLIEDEQGFIWGSTGIYGWTGNPLNDLNRLICFDPETENFKHYKHNPENPGSLSSNKVWSVYKDRSGILWIGTGWQGLNKWDRKKYKFKRLNNDSDNQESGHIKKVSPMIEDQGRIIWFGNENGLYSYNPLSEEVQNLKYNTKDNNNLVNQMYKDEDGIIWFGTATKGLGKFNTVNGSFHFYSNDPNNSSSISHNLVRYVLQGENDVLWIGTYGGGLNRFDKNTGNFTHYKHDPNNPQSLSSNFVMGIYKDRKGTLWIGTDDGGLNRFNRGDETFNSFDMEGLSTTIYSIYEDRKGNFWIGTMHSGIYLFDRDKGISISNITQKDGLANNHVKSMLEDDSGNLWIGTQNGLSRFDPETRAIKNYFSPEGFDRNLYKYVNSIKTSTGKMLFSTFDGFIMFNPDSIKDDPVPPQVVISNVSLYNRPGEKLTFNGFISELDGLDLSYNENDLRFDYVGLHFGEPEKNRYKYMLENFDEDWIDAGTQRNATYTNLDAGEYVFRVTACNRDGVWNEKGASLKIIIPPPFWATWWAYGLYLIVLGSSLYGIRKYEMNRLNWKNQSKLDEVKLIEREETDKMKSRFFANISHEFRTPLTLILGPIENILSRSDDETQKQASLVKRNASRLLVLINQLMDLSKLEAGKLELKASKSNIVSFIKGMTMSFESVAERKDITLKVKTTRDEIEIYFDKEKMTKIMMNLLMNAFKFTRDGGQITVTINESDNNSVRIKVKDTGVGIAEEELPKLFDRFYQVDSSRTREHEGTGIGLALTKELVDLHHGQISVDSKLGEWTEFTIELRTGSKHLKDEEIVEIEEPIRDDIIVDKEEFVPLSVEEIKETGVIREDKNILLIVEDNADVREYIKDSLGNDFHIEEASNGEQGVRKAEQIIPDLIISDIMMPKMDGNELTRILKNDEKTSHIPIILLTAKSEQESKLEGLQTGADDYLTKPFDTNELQIRIKNLIKIRRKLQNKYGTRLWR